MQSAVELLRSQGLVSVVNGRGSFVRPDALSGSSGPGE
jgi:DNA-binding GntR family transcriptional regulator